MTLLARALITLIVLLSLAYLMILAFSSAHLAQLYHLFNADLPTWLPLAIAVAVEFTAFGLSATTVVATDRLDARYATAGAWFLLSIVAAGNFYSMHQSATAAPLWVVALATAHVPATLILGKVVGGLLAWLEREMTPAAPPVRRRRPTQLHAEPEPTQATPRPEAEHRDMTTLPDPDEAIIAATLENDRLTTKQVAALIGKTPSVSRRLLERMRERGLIRSTKKGWVKA